MRLEEEGAAAGIGLADCSPPFPLANRSISEEEDGGESEDEAGFE